MSLASASPVKWFVERPANSPSARPGGRAPRDLWARAAGLLLRALGVFNWRHGAEAAKRQPTVLRIADALGREAGRIRFLDDLSPPPPAPRVPDLASFLAADLAAIWIGHATLLLRIGGRTILTDAVFSTRVGISLVFATLGPRRLQRPAMTVAQLPPLDLILSSHAHFDHLDRPSLWRLARRFRDVPIVAATGTRDLINDLGYRRVSEMAWGDSINAGGLQVSPVAVRHWGPRVFYDNWRGYNAYLVERNGQRVIFGADTALTDSFRGVGPVDLMAVGIGAYDPYIAAHASPEQAWQMAMDAAARRVLPMHHSTFRLSHEPMDEPIRRLLAAAGGERHRVVAQRVGDTWSERR